MVDKVVESIIETVKTLLKMLAIGVIKGSFWICLISGMIALLLYISGQRKAGKYISMSFVIYVLLQVLKGAFNL